MSNPVSVITLTTGQENVEGALSKFYAWVVAPNGEEGYASKVLKPLGAPRYEDAVPGMRRDVCGSWATQSFECEDGTLLKIFLSSTGAWGQIPRYGLMFVQVRAAGTFYKIRAQLSGHPRCSRRDAEMHIPGDLLTLEEAVAAGLVIKPAMRDATARWTTLKSVRDCFTITVLERARSARPLTRVINVAKDKEKTLVRTKVKARRLAVQPPKIETPLKTFADLVTEEPKPAAEEKKAPAIPVRRRHIRF